MLIKFLVWSFIFYVLYKFIFGFLLPVRKITKEMRSKFEEMNEKQHQFYQQNQDNFSQQPPLNNQQPKTNPQKNKDIDYIEYEEIK